MSASSRPTPPRSLLRRLVALTAAVICWSGIAFLAAAGAACLLADRWWGFDMASHFRPQYLILAAVLVLVSLLARAPVRASLAVLLALIHVPAAMSLWVGGPAPGAANASTAAPLRILSANLLYRNARIGDGLRALAAEDADVIVLQEAAGMISAIHTVLGPEYPFLITDVGRTDGIVVASRYPLSNTHLTMSPGPLRDHLFFTTMTVDDQAVTLIVTHPPQPLGGRLANMTRYRQFGVIAELAQAIEGPMIVAGDFNSTVWSPSFARMLEEGGLQDAAQGRGWMPTWHPWIRGGRLLSVPIDHVLVRGGVEVETFRVGPNIGSDHRPVEASLRLPAAE